MIEYRPAEIETAVQDAWTKARTFEVSEDKTKPKFYCLSMFPYPSGRLHMGHVRNYTIGDVIARYQRMLGKNVLQPMGWDAFGMPAENAAIKNNVAPAEWTYANIDYMREQLKRLGLAYDWRREVTTCKPEYYRWEQWLFTRLYAKGLVYKKVAPVNWCPNDKTVLANEQVKDGRCWRCDTLVERKEISQWFMKITQYAEELLSELDHLTGWPDAVRIMQRNWIGRSEGVDIDFSVVDSSQKLTVYTTRPDTLLGVSYLAVATDHPLSLLAAKTNVALQQFNDDCRKQDTTEATLETMEKSGIATGLYAIHPVTGEKVPVWAANFVLMGYGTGAVMSVPAHDQRDYEFALKYNLPIKQVIFSIQEGAADLTKAAFVDKGVLKNSGEFDGLDSDRAFGKISDWLQSQGKGLRKVNYRLRDWGVSRQRYWGTPIPMIYCASCGTVPVPDQNLPVLLPEKVKFDALGSPLKKMPEFYKTQCPQCKGAAERETDTFDTFMESSWYYARYACSGQDKTMVDERAHYWLPVDQYIGGIEHAVMHLLYARFFHKLMRDVGLVKGNEPFTHLLTQGMVVAETYYRLDADKKEQYFAPNDVCIERDPKGRVIGATLASDGNALTLGGIEKMSKSKNNGVDPQFLIARYGADTVRLFTMFASPPTQSLEWNDDGVEGCFRFLKRVWRFVSEQAVADYIKQSNSKGAPIIVGELDSAQKKIRTEIHQLLDQINRDVEKYQFNTVVAAGMKILNSLSELDHSSQVALGLISESVSILLRVLYPIVPHITTELWQQLTFTPAIEDASWPKPDANALQKEALNMAIMINGKRRGEIEVGLDWDNQRIEQQVMLDAGARRHLEGLTIKKVVVVTGKLINIVATK